jgi:hypothetical protein
MKNNVKLCLIIISFFFLTSCGSAQSGYPILLSEGKRINPEYSKFEIQPRTFVNREMISIGLDLEGNTICYDRNSKSRLCSQALRINRPFCKFPEELRFDPDKKYSNEEIKTLNENTTDWAKRNCEPQRNAWEDTVEKQSLLEFEVVAIDSNNQEIPFVWAGAGAGYCRSEKDQLCNQYDIDEKISKVKTLDGIIIKALKIKSVEGELKVSNIYVVGPYRRD